jgi:hypothetical protein
MSFVPEELLKSIEDDDRSLWFILQGEVEDFQTDILDQADLWKMMSIFKDRGAPIHWGHRKGKHVGRGVEFYKLHVKLPTGDIVPAILGRGEIFKHYRMDNEVWKAIEDEEIQMVSIGSLSYLKQMLKDDEGHQATLRKDFEPFHIALEPAGACPMSYILKAGPTSYMDRLTAQGLKVIAPKELSKYLQSMSLGTLSEGQAYEIAKSLSEHADSDTPKEETSMEPTEIEKKLESLDGLTADVSEMKKAVDTLVDIVTNQAEKVSEMEKSLKIPPKQLGGKQKSVKTSGGKPILKEVEVEDEPAEVEKKVDFDWEKMEELVKSAVKVEVEKSVVAEGETPDPAGDDPDELLKARGSPTKDKGMFHTQEDHQMMEDEKALRPTVYGI